MASEEKKFFFYLQIIMIGSDKVSVGDHNNLSFYLQTFS